MNTSRYCPRHATIEHNPNHPCAECIVEDWTAIVRAATYVPHKTWVAACHAAGVPISCLEHPPHLGIIENGGPR